MFCFMHFGGTEVKGRPLSRFSSSTASCSSRSFPSQDSFQDKKPIPRSAWRAIPPPHKLTERIESKKRKHKVKKRHRSAVPGHCRIHSRKDRHKNSSKDDMNSTKRRALSMHSCCYKQVIRFSLALICLMSGSVRHASQASCSSPFSPRSWVSCSVFACMPLITNRLMFPWFLVFRLPFRLSIWVPPPPFVVGDAASLGCSPKIGRAHV